MRPYYALLIAALALGCSGPEVHYNPTPQILPQNVRRIAQRFSGTEVHT